jgi:hypothetical protein
MLKNSRYARATWFSALLIAPALLADCSSGPLSLGGNGGSSEAGSSAVAGAGGSGGSPATCATADCGPQLGIANSQCPDGSTAGPTGRCLKHDNGTCGWEILSCPPGGGGSGGASAGAGGQAAGGTSSGTCGGHVCTADQVWCGPAVCGFCVSKVSGIACPAECPGGGGAGGASGGASSGGAGGASGGAGGADCATLLADVKSKLAAAQSCNPASAKPTLECAGTLEGLCCPVLVEAATASNASANNAYLDALHSYKQKCAHICPEIACLNPQPGDCVVQSTTHGTCGGGTGF